MAAASTGGFSLARRQGMVRARTRSLHDGGTVSSGGEQTASSKESALHRREDDVVDRDADDEDGEDSREHLRQVEERATIVEQRPQAGPGERANDQLGRHQRPPRERPCLLHPGNVAGKQRREDEVAICLLYTS